MAQGWPWVGRARSKIELGPGRGQAKDHMMLGQHHPKPSA